MICVKKILLVVSVWIFSGSNTAAVLTDGQLNDDVMCEQLVCFNPLRGQCTSSVELRAAEGTTCADRKWCRNGRCVFDPAAPQSPAFCLSGDLRGDFEHSVGKSCQTILEETPADCYLSLFREPCCHTCELLRNRERPDCPYGDRHVYCRDVQTYECYSDETRNTCCEFCEKVRRPVHGCEYGDRALWCRTSDPGHICYSQANICCQTCEETRDQNNPDCSWGDEASWCHRLDRDRCYFPEDRRKCCRRCEGFRTSIEGCEYGDRLADCGGRDCSLQYYQHHCCYTCRRETGHNTQVPLTEAAPPTTATVTGSAASSVDIPPSSTFQPLENAPRSTETLRECIMVGVDSAEWCGRIHGFNCYQDYEVCCLTCPQYRTGINGCDYGDRVSWCPTIFPGQCYEEDIRYKCCLTCPRLLQNVAGCEFGDRYSWCSALEPERCLEQDMEASCCMTCRTSQRLPTTMASAGAAATTFLASDMGPLGCSTPDKASWCQEKKFRAICYSDPATCCDTCRQRWTGIPDCPYGDRVSWCPDGEIGSCTTDAYYRQQCCQTCSSSQNTLSPLDDAIAIKSASPEDSQFCQSPDEGSWCKSLQAHECYWSQEMCCESCLLHYTAVEGCEFGDHHESCRGLRAQSCYFPEYPSICCATCTAFATGLPGCEYGDQLEDCRAANCSDSIVGRICCHTCWQRKDTIAWKFIEMPANQDCQDTETWCATTPPEDCYTEHHICCRSCSQYFTGIKDCEYQDQVSWCTSVIQTADDCTEEAIREACCFTCGMFSLVVQGNVTTLREGAIIHIMNTSLAQVRSRQPILLNVLRLTLAAYCQVHAGECCSLLLLSDNSVTVQHMGPGDDFSRLMRDGDVVIPEGYPQQLSDREIILKVLVTINVAQIEPLCGIHLRHRRSANGHIPLYFNHALLSKILGNNTEHISQRTHLHIWQVSAEDTLQEDPQSFSVPWLMVSVGVFTAMVIMVTTYLVWSRLITRGCVVPASMCAEAVYLESTVAIPNLDLQASEQVGPDNLVLVDSGLQHPLNEQPPPESGSATH